MDLAIGLGFLALVSAGLAFYTFLTGAVSSAKGSKSSSSVALGAYCLAPALSAHFLRRVGLKVEIC